MRKTSSLEQAIQVVSTLAIEDIYLDENSKKNLIAVVNGEKTTQEILTELNKKYDKQEVLKSNLRHSKCNTF